MTKEDKFNKFWTYYPRKVARVAAQRSWKRLKVKDINDIFSVYKEHLIRWKYKDIQFVPHASTWLNQRRFEDEWTFDGPTARGVMGLSLTEPNTLDERVIALFI